MKKSAIRGSIKELGGYRPITIKFIDIESEVEDKLECIARPVALPTAVAELGVQYEEAQAGNADPLTNKETIALLNGLVVGCATSILSWDMKDDMDRLLKPDVAEFRSWPIDELANFWALLQAALAEAPKGRSSS